MEQILLLLAEYGLPGTIIALLVAYVRALQNRLKGCQDARVEDAKQFGERALGIQEKALDASNSMRETTDKLCALVDHVASRKRD